MPNATWPFNETAEDRFWAKVDVRSPDECWPWIAGKRKGYGWFRPGGHETTPLAASRCAWALIHGILPSSKAPICHTCDNRPCCNPGHLYLGTHASNAADKVARGRHLHGETHPLARLTDAQVREIRCLYATGAHTQRSIGTMLGLSQKTVSMIVRQQRWAHVR